jgi:hypothetical protein
VYGSRIVPFSGSADNGLGVAAIGCCRIVRNGRSKSDAIAYLTVQMRAIDQAGRVDRVLGRLKFRWLAVANECSLRGNGEHEENCSLPGFPRSPN